MVHHSEAAPGLATLARLGVGASGRLEKSTEIPLHRSPISMGADRCLSSPRTCGFTGRGVSDLSVMVD